MPTLDQLEIQLRGARRFWQYETHIEGKALTDDQKIAVAQQVLAAGKPWAQGLADEFAARTYPPGFDEDDE